MESTLKLVFPTLDHKDDAWTYRQEHIVYGEPTIHGSGGLLRMENYESWLEKITNALSAPQTGRVNCQTYFAFYKDTIVGTIQIRETLNDALMNTGGHIGYGVRPSERRKGYATAMLFLALEKCRKLGMEKVLITCDKSNIASAKTIQKCNGILENEFIESDDNIIQRYWIKL